LLTILLLQVAVVVEELLPMPQVAVVQVDFVQL
jgi:hypothetical protein